MPSYLDFDSTKKFRDYILGRTLKKDNGPQTFSANNYTEQSTSDVPNKDLGGVVPTNPNLNGQRIINLYNPEEVNYIQELNVVNFSEVLDLYPYFLYSDHNLVGIMSNSNFETESKLFQFAANNIKNNPEGPVLSRLSRNIEKTTNGRVRLLDALNGNTSTAINLVTGREPLVDPNYQITVAKTLPGKAIDLLEVIAGVTSPFSEIPGNYLSKPNHPGNEIEYRPKAETQLGKIYQDVTGALGSLIGIQRRPTVDRKPSDLLLEHTSQGQKNRLYEMISYNNYGPNYTTSARSQNTSKIFNFVDQAAQGVKNLLGVEAPVSKAYIGDDRGDDVKLFMGDMHDRIVKSPYYLSLKFEGEKTTDIWHNPKYNKNISEGGSVSGNYTWITNSTNDFEKKSLLYKTQQLINTNNGDKSHVGYVIDQTTKYFKDGDVNISRGSAIRYTNKITGVEEGIEYCRVWTKDKPYLRLNNTMKKTSNYRKFDGSVLGGDSRVWNLNIAPMSNGKNSFDGSTNIVSGSTLYGNNFYAKKYMFSIENLAWKTSNKPYYTVNDLPACERGPNGGRVMWFPPYDLKVTEQNTANWDKNSFLGRPEPIYTYLDTERNGTISFKVVVDHPSILNLLIKKYFENWDDEKADNYINEFFAGCQDLDFYELVKTYTTLDKDDISLIKQYLNSGTSKEIIENFKYTSEPITEVNPGGTNPKKDNTSPNGEINSNFTFYFENDFPKKGESLGVGTSNLQSLFNDYTGKKSDYISVQFSDLTNLKTTGTTKQDYEDQIGAFGKSGSTSMAIVNVNEITGKTDTAFTDYTNKFNNYTTTLSALKQDILSGYTQDIKILVFTSTSEVATSEYNFYLGTRRAYSIVKDVVEKVTFDGAKAPTFKWFTDDFLKQNWKTGLKFDETTRKDFSFKDLGYDKEGTLTIFVSTFGEETNTLNVAGENNINCKQAYNNKSLKITAPQAFFCRQGSVKIKYKRDVPQAPETDQGKTFTVPKINVSLDSQEITTIRPKPSIDVMKRIIMKVLSECYYFQQLKEDSPFVFKSLTEKLKYFHPAFHSMTPEGLNSRLTFLNQCLRPGDTIPVKGTSDQRDLNARNTAFGPPPVCILRIGDFYHSKIIINNLNITYDDATWDLNPEGIGVQPMLANVTLQVIFLGGHGLEKPVEKLQNALSSNFYANTEMYDERAISTATMINGKKADDFTKEFLEDLVKRNSLDLNAKETEPNTKIALGVYMGSLTGSNLDYTKLISSLDEKIQGYISSYQNTINICNKKYGTFLTPLLLHQNFRKIKDLVIFTGATSGTTTLFGEYPNREEIGPLIDNKFKGKFWDITNDNNTDILSIIGLNMITEEYYDDFNNLLRYQIISYSKEFFDNIIKETSVVSLQKARVEIVNIIDKLNYILETNTDAQINGVTTTKAILSGFTGQTFYETYGNKIDWLIKSNTKSMTYVSGTTINDYENLSNDNYKKILKTLLYGKNDDIVKNAYTLGIVDSIGTSIIDDIIKSLNSFTTQEKDITISLDKFPVSKNDKKIIYTISSTAEETTPVLKEKVRKIFRDKNEKGDKLNFYKP